MTTPEYDLARARLNSTNAVARRGPAAILTALDDTDACYRARLALEQRYDPHRIAEALNGYSTITAEQRRHLAGVIYGSVGCAYPLTPCPACEAASGFVPLVTR